MPIVVEYQPSFALAGQLAYEGALGQYEQEQAKFQLSQAELAERIRQADQRFALESQNQFLRDQDSQRDFYANQANQAGELQYRYDNMAAQMASEAGQQQNYADSIEAQYASSMNREMMESARAAENRRFQAAIKQQESLQQYIQDNRLVLSPDQVMDLQNQFQETTGLEYGFDMSQALRAQEAVEGTAMARRVQAMREFTETGVVGDDLATEMYRDPDLRQEVLRGLQSYRTNELQREQNASEVAYRQKDQELKQQELDLRKPQEEERRLLEARNRIDAGYQAAFEQRQKAQEYDDTLAIDTGAELQRIDDKDPRIIWPVVYTDIEESLVPVNMPYRRYDGLFIKRPVPGTNTFKSERLQ